MVLVNWSSSIEPYTALSLPKGCCSSISSKATRLGRCRPFEYRRIRLQLPLARCVSLAVTRVNSPPHWGHSTFFALPDFSFWCLFRLLHVENTRPLQPCSQHCALPSPFAAAAWLSFSAALFTGSVVSSHTGYGFGIKNWVWSTCSIGELNGDGALLLLLERSLSNG